MNIYSISTEKKSSDIARMFYSGSRVLCMTRTMAAKVKGIQRNERERERRADDGKA